MTHNNHLFLPKIARKNLYTRQMRATKESLTNLLTTFAKSESHEIKFYGYFYQKNLFRL